MNIIDVVVLIIILLAALNGFRRGVLNSIAMFISTFVVFIVAYYLKNPVSIFLYEYMPFFKLGGVFSNAPVFNIFIYEAISYFITISLLGFLIRILANVTGAIEALLKATVVLSIPSKILGFVFGIFLGWIVSFLLIFVLMMLAPNLEMVNNSKSRDLLMNNTPVLSGIANNTYNGLSEVYEIVMNKDSKDPNIESLDVMLKYDIITISSADKLVEKGKIEKRATSVIDKHRAN